MERHDPQDRVTAHHRSGTGVKKIGYPIGIRTPTVLRKEYVTATILRLTLGGSECDGFHTYHADDHVKIVFPDPDGTLRLPVPDDELSLDWPRPSVRTRTYTIRRYDADAREIDLDIVVHPGGLASDWAVAVQPGEPVPIAGPPGAKAFAQTYGHYVFAVDATALPALARWLEESPEDVSAHVVVETEDADQHGYPLTARNRVDVTWLLREPGASRLAETVEALTLPPATTFLFAAGEAQDLKPLRAWASGRLDALFTGYWRRGVAGFES